MNIKSVSHVHLAAENQRFHMYPTQTTKKKSTNSPPTKYPTPKLIQKFYPTILIISDAATVTHTPSLQDAKTCWNHQPTSNSKKTLHLKPNLFKPDKASQGKQG
jgi:hypothetical protein